MTRVPDKARLRNTLRKLNQARGAIADAAGRAEAGQETLDFLAMLAGIKPVFLLGRGLDEPRWIRGVLQIAIDRGLYVTEGPYWDTGAGFDGLPDWYAGHARAQLAGFRAHYICRARAAAEEVAELCRDGASTVEREARLLGYPACCVAAHYARGLAFQLVWLDILRRAAGGDEAEMQRRLADGAMPSPETEDERARLAAAAAVRPAPFTSVNMCESCAAGPETPAMTLSSRYRALAEAIDPALARELAPGAGLAQ